MVLYDNININIDIIKYFKNIKKIEVYTATTM